MEQKIYTVEIDSPPGNPRPDELFPGVIEGTGLSVDDFTLGSTFFGNWTWIVKEAKREEYAKQRTVVQRRITALYDAGVLRYGSW